MPLLLELALKSRLSESRDSPTHCELSWIPGGSVGFLIDLFRIFELTMVVVRKRGVWKERIYVPNNKKLRKEILKEHHDLADIRHLGQHKMLELLKRTYWWLELKENIMEKFTKVLGTKRKLSTAYHPQTDRQMERINQEIEMFLQHYMNYQQDDWTNWLATAEFSYNDKKYVAIGKTPFELNFERHSWKGDLMVQIEISQVEEFIKNLQKSWKHAVHTMEESQKNIK